MRSNKKIPVPFLKGFLSLLLVSVAIIALLFPVMVLVHEGTHYIMYTLEGTTVISFHVLDRDSMENGWYGYVTTPKESKYGSMVKEGVAYFFGYLFLASTLLFCLIKPLKPFTIHQLKLMGAKKNFIAKPELKSC